MFNPCAAVPWEHIFWRETAASFPALVPLKTKSKVVAQCPQKKSLTTAETLGEPAWAKDSELARAFFGSLSLYMANMFSMFFFSLLSLVFSRGSLKECESSGFLQDFVHFFNGHVFYLCFVGQKHENLFKMLIS